MKMENILIFGQENKLAKEYVYPELALEEIKVKESKVLDILQNRYGIEKLDSSSYKLYIESLHKINEEAPEILSQKDEQYRNVEIFLLNYANKDRNKYVKDLVNKLEEVKEQEELMNIEKEIASNLPYFSPFTLQYYENYRKYLKNNELYTMAESTATPIQNKYNACEYSKKYAVNPNTDGRYPYYKDGDCANFVSQILEASGVSPIPAVWEVKRHLWLSPTKNWSVADNFVKFWGVRDTTTSHRYFSSRINRGDIIAYDNTGDGIWDHVAFVENADDYIATYDGNTCYDYQVAQHTSNYIDWTSHDGNNWDRLEHWFPGLVFGVIGD